MSSAQQQQQQQITLSQSYIDACAKRSLKPNSSLVAYLAQFNLCPDHLTELDLSRTSYVGPQGFIPVIESIILSPVTKNLKVLNASDNRITNESLDVLLAALVDRFASTKFAFSPSATSLTNNSYFEFALDVSKNPITYLGGKSILAFLAQIKENNEKRINRIPIAIDVNVDNTLVTPTGIVSIDEICQKQRLEVKFCEKIGDPRKELEEIERKDQQHKEMIAETERTKDKERAEMIERESVRMEAERVEEEKLKQEEEERKAKEAEKRKQARFPYFLRNNNTINKNNASVEIVATSEKETADENENKFEKEISPSSSHPKEAVIEEVAKEVPSRATNAPPSSIKNIFIFHLTSKSFRPATQNDEISELDSTHECFLKPFKTYQFGEENQNADDDDFPSKSFSPHFPPLLISAFPRNIREQLLQDQEHVKQYWVPKKSNDNANGSNNNNNDGNSSSPFLTEKQKQSMWVGASHAEKNLAENPSGAVPLPGSASDRRKPARKSDYRYPESESERDSDDDDGPPRKKASKKMMKRRLS